VGLLDGRVEAARKDVCVVLEVDHQPLLLPHTAKGALVQLVRVMEKQILLTAQLKAHSRWRRGVALNAHAATDRLKGAHLLGRLVVLLDAHLKGALQEGGGKRWGGDGGGGGGE
jgi:hypothetical protein